MRDLDTGDVWSATLPADRARAGRIRSDVRAGPRRVPPPRRRHRDPHRDRRLARGRRGAAARLGDQPRHRDAAPRPDQLRRGRARAGRRRPRASGVQQPVRRDPQRAGARRADLRAAAALGRRPRCTSCTSSAAAAAAASPTQCETDRARFIGRGGTLRSAAGADRQGAALEYDRRRSSIRSSACASRVRLAPGATARITFTTGYAESEEARARLIEKYHDRRAVARALALASTHSQIELRHLDLTVEDTIEFQRLGGRLMYGRPAAARRRTRSSENRSGQRELWKYGISGDLPILLVRVTDEAGVAAGRRAAEGARVSAPQGTVVRPRHPQRASAPATCRTSTKQLQRLVESGPEQGWIDKPGGVFLRRADLMPAEDQLLLRAAARVVMDAADGAAAQPADAPARAVRAGPDAVARSPTARCRSRLRCRRRRRPRAGGSSCSTASAGSPTAAASTSITGERGHRAAASAVDQRRRQRDASGSRAPSRGPATRGRRTATTTASRPGATIRSAIRRARPCSSATRTAGRSGPPTPLPAGGGHPYTVRHGHGYSVYEHARDELASELMLVRAAATSR